MLLNTLKLIVTQPLNKNRKVNALKDWLYWQIGARLVPGAVEVSFVNDAYLLIKPGMTGATGNIYLGLAEFDDMGFLLHFLGPDDLFVDIGANIGSFTVLASKVVGSHSISIEPLPSTCLTLKKNILINRIQDKVSIFNYALGKTEGLIYFTSDLDTMNHAVEYPNGNIQNLCEVQVKTLDSLLQGKIPQLIKIDVEGYETSVFEGAIKTLKSNKQHAVIMELNGCGQKFGFDDKKLHQRMLSFGYIAVSYNPLTRDMKKLAQANHVGNTIYIKSSLYGSIQHSMKNAPAFFVKGQSV